MRRRGVLGLLGGALAAGPSMAKEAVSSIASMQVPGAIEGAHQLGTIISESHNQSLGSTPYDHTAWLKDRLLELTGMTDEARRERMEGTWVQSLDPDLAVNRSFSLSTKVQIQKRRNFEKNLNSEKRSLMRQIADFMKQQQ